MLNSTFEIKQAGCTAPPSAPPPSPLPLGFHPLPPLMRMQASSATAGGTPAEEKHPQKAADAMVASKMKGKSMNAAQNYIRKDTKGTISPDFSGCDFNFRDIAWVRIGLCSWWPAQVIDEKGVSPKSKPRKKAAGEALVRLYGTYNYLYINPVKNNEEFENTLQQSNSNVKEVLEKALEEDLCRVKGRRKTKKNLSGSRVVEMRGRTERNVDAKLIAWGGHTRVCTLHNLEQDDVVKEKTGKRTLKQQDITKPEQDEWKVKEKAAKHVVSNQHLEKKPKLTETTGSEVSKHSSQTQVSGMKSKQQAVAKCDKGVIHGSGKHAQVGKKPDASARRIKVMQNLGLIAPSGSPFHKSWPVKAASCKS